MTTVASRTFRSSPYRSAAATWEAIVAILTGSKDGAPRTELLAVTGIAASMIADQAAKSAPIVVTCTGPRTRIYCVYDEDTLDDSGANEDGLGFDALKGEWSVSLPCTADDLSWVQAALKKHSTKITARDLAKGINIADSRPTDSRSLTIDVEGFLKP